MTKPIFRLAHQQVSGRSWGWGCAMGWGCAIGCGVLFGMTVFVVGRFRGAEPTDAPAASPANTAPAALQRPATLPRRKTHRDPHVRPCQWTAPGCHPASGHGERRPTCAWPNAGQGPNTPFGHGSYLRPGRIPHVGQYRLRVDDILNVVFRRTRIRTARPYALNAGDRIRVEVKGEAHIARVLDVQPDGSITLPEIGQVQATRRTVRQLREELVKRYRELIQRPVVTVTPIQINTRLEDLLESVDQRYGQGGLGLEVRVTPDGTIAMPALGSVAAQGLTLDELRRELDSRYAVLVAGLDAQPVLVARAPRFVFVLGEVARPGRYTLEGPTTAMQAMALAGGITTAAAAKIQHVVIFRRGPDWRMKATLLNLRGTVVSGHANRRRVDELWLADSDVVLVPKSGMLVADEYIDLLFTNGIYRVFPMRSTLSFSKLSTL